MNFLYPQFLWALTLLAIPIIIHLFNFKRYKTLYFSSLQFVKHVDQKTKSTQRLKHYLILTSRILAFTFLIFAFAQPYFGVKNAETVGSRNIVCLYIDNSYSMEARGPEGELISEAREQAKKIIEQCKTNVQFLIATNDMSASEERLLNKADAIDKVDNIQLSSINKEVTSVIEWQEETIQRLQDDQQVTFQVQSYILSDFQSNTSNNQLNLTTSTNFHPIQFKATSSDNLLIDSVWFSSPLRKIGSNNEINISVRNNSNEDLKNAEIDIQIGDVKKVIFTDVEANKNKVSSFTYTNTTSGFIEGKITVSDKYVHFDDTYFISYNVEENINVLILDGEDAIPNFSIIYSLDDYYKLDSKPITSITSDDFQQKNLVLLNGINGISPGVITYLDKFIQNGGSVAIFPGKNLAQDNINQFLGKHRLPLVTGTTNQGTKITTINYSDPFFQSVFETKPNNINLPGLQTIYKNTSQGSNSLINVQTGQPLLSYSNDKGQLTMFYASLHPNNGTLVKNILISSIVLRLGELSNRKQPLALDLGTTASFPIYSKIESDEVVKIKNKDFEFIPRQENLGGVTYISLNSIDANNYLKAGNYDLINKDKISSLSLNYSRKESNLSTLSLESIEALFKSDINDVKITQIQDNIDLSTIDVNKPSSYWKFCIVLTLIFVFIEMLIVRFLK